MPYSEGTLVLYVLYSTDGEYCTVLYYETRNCYSDCTKPGEDADGNLDL